MFEAVCGDLDCQLTDALRDRVERHCVLRIELGVDLGLCSAPGVPYVPVCEVHGLLKARLHADLFDGRVERPRHQACSSEGSPTSSTSGGMGAGCSASNSSTLIF